MYQLLYDRQVVRHDIPALSSTIKQRICTAIEQKLGTHPDLYGIPLRRTLKGYRKLRIGDYRVVFKIESSTVKILFIGHRSVVYPLTEKRLNQ